MTSKSGLIVGLLWLVGCQLVGEVVVRLLDITVPGPVVGMVVLLVVLRVRDLADDHPVMATGTRVLEHLQLLFVPAGVGVVAYGAIVRGDAPGLALALVASWLAGLLVVVGTITLLGRRHLSCD